MSVEERIAGIEARLAKIEQRLGQPRQPAQPTPAAQPVPSSITQSTPAPSQPAVVRQSASAEVPPDDWAAIKARSTEEKDSGSSVTNFLGWSGATALVLAAIYLVSLAIDTGWLTPARQLVLANLLAFTCIGTGLWLRDGDKRYASLLPAAGVVILFLTIYAAHNYYHFIDIAPATAGIIATCLLSLWLCHVFQSDLYAFFAVLGSYTAPVFIGGGSYGIWDLVTYLVVLNG